MKKTKILSGACFWALAIAWYARVWVRDVEDSTYQAPDVSPGMYHLMISGLNHDGKICLAPDLSSDVSPEMFWS